MNIRRLLAGFSLAVTGLSFSSGVAAAEFCDDAYYIDQTLSNSARWDMCWTHDNQHGIRYHHIHYTPRNGQRRMVLKDAAVSQIHVPYDDNGARFHDVSDYGLGSGYLRDIASSECAGGTRRRYGTKNAVCTQVKQYGDAFRTDSSISQEAEALKVFSISKVGAYVYMPIWKFFDNGRMEPSIGATGSLQRFGSNTVEAHGWLLADRAGEATRRIGLSHVHNYFWRLDFDLNGTSNDDRVEEINVNLSGGQRRVSVNRFTTETSRSLAPSKYRTWLVRDGSERNANNQLMAYEIRLDEAGHREVGPDTERFTHKDFYVTRARSCEQIASHNKRVNTCTADSLDEFANGEGINGQDTVVWVGVSFYHMPRSEDYPKMDAHSNRFQLIPRSWHASNPLVDSGTTNTQPLAANPDSFNASGTTITIDPLANDTGSGLTLIAPSAWSLEGAQVALSNNKLTYKAKPGFNGTDKIWYTVQDASGAQAWSEITITVSGNGGSANPFPVGAPDTFSATAGVAKTLDVLANDTGNGKVLVAPNAWSLKGGSVALVSNKLRYTAKSDFNGEDKIWYNFNDVDGRGAWAEVTINVTGGAASNPFPAAAADTFSVSAGSTRTFDVLANDTGNGKVLVAPNAWSLQGGNVALVNNKLSYTPKAGYSGVDKIWYTFNDVEGRSAWGEVTINVSP